MPRSFCVQINYVTVPAAVQNNSEEAVILDCNYSVRPDDQDLVVKWYLNGDVVYQWIPPQPPQSLGILRDRLDLSYKASDDPKTIYRAMKIVNVSSEIAGDYKCFVSTFADEDFTSKKLTVFEPEHELMLFQSYPDLEGNINFTCTATDVYPQPKLSIYRDKNDDIQSRRVMEGIEWNVSKHANGKFSVYMIATSKVSRLEPGSLINCEIKIHGTGYIKRKTLLYYPKDFEKDEGTLKKTLPVLVLSAVIFSASLL